MLNLFLVRGISGAGKSTLTNQLDVVCFEADQFFMVDGVYKFDPGKLAEAHQTCQDKTRESLRNSVSVAVSNTFTQRWEMEPYIQMAKEFGARLTVVDLFDGGCSNEVLASRNAHGTPIEVISKMRQRYEHDWANGKTTPPWHDLF
jgi:predicted kinase